jgi:hypothetical protein
MLVFLPIFSNVIPAVLSHAVAWPGVNNSAFWGHKTIARNTDFYSVLGKYRYFVGLQPLVLSFKACKFSLKLPTSVIL